MVTGVRRRGWTHPRFLSPQQELAAHSASAPNARDKLLIHAGCLLRALGRENQARMGSRSPGIAVKSTQGLPVVAIPPYRREWVQCLFHDKQVPKTNADANKRRPTPSRREDQRAKNRRSHLKVSSGATVSRVVSVAPPV